MPFVDDVNLLLRDHLGYSGDGQGGRGALPVGDRSTARNMIDQRDLRQLLITMAQAMGDPSALQEIISGLDRKTDLPNSTKSFPSREAAVGVGQAALPASLVLIYTREPGYLVQRQHSESGDDPLFATAPFWGVAARFPLREVVEAGEAAARQRANHTGVQPIASVDGLPAQLNSLSYGLTSGLALEAAARAQAVAALRKDAAHPIRRQAVMDANRPGDAPQLFTASLSGGDPYSAAEIAATTPTSEGEVARITGAGIIGHRGLHALEPDRTYRVRFVIRRIANSPDPSNDAVVLAIGWYDRAKSARVPAFGTAVELKNLTVADGRRVFESTVSRTPGADLMPPAGTLYARPFVRAYGTSSLTDVEVIDWQDITDLSVWAPDVSEFASRLVAIEAEGLSERVTELEQGAGTASTVRFPSRNAAMAAHIRETAEVVDIPGLGAFVRRAGGKAFTSADGAEWASIVAATPRQQGAFAAGDVDETAAVNAAVETGRADLLGGTYATSQAITVPARAVIEGNGAKVLNRSTGTANGVVVSEGAVVRDLEVDMGMREGRTDGQGIMMRGSNCWLEYVTVKNFGTDDPFEGAGTGIIDPSSVRSEGLRIHNALIEGVRDAVLGFGWLFSNDYYSFADNISVRDVSRYAHELKNVCEYNILHALLAIDSQYALAFGQSDTAGSNRNLVFGTLGARTDSGVLANYASENLFAAAAYHQDIVQKYVPYSPSMHGIRLVKSDRNGFDTHLLTGDLYNFGVRIEGWDNYLEILNHTPSPVLRLEGDQGRNILNVQHPGRHRNSLLNAFSVTGGPFVYRGPTANVIHCAGTGERIGSLSGAFHDRLGVSGAGVTSTHGWRFENDAEVILAGMTPMDQSFGLAHHVPGRARSGAVTHVSRVDAATEYWQFRSGGVDVLQVGRGSVRPVGDNIYNLGRPGDRFQNIYGATGMVNTSDRREKTDISDVDDRLLDAMAGIGIKAFRWIEAVREKGELARIHYGPIAQDVRDAVMAQGINPTRCAFLCYDSWEDTTEIIPAQFIEHEAVVIAHEEVLSDDLDAEGQRIVLEEAWDEEVAPAWQEEIEPERVVVTPAGDRWGIRPDQLLFVYIAYQDRRMSRIEARLDAIGG